MPAAVKTRTTAAWELRLGGGWSLRCALVHRSESKRRQPSRENEGSRRSGSKCTYGGEIARRTAADGGAPREMRFALIEACNSGEDRGGDAEFPRGLLPAYGVSGMHRVAWALELDPARCRVRGVRRCPARGSRVGRGAHGQWLEARWIGRGSGASDAAAYRFAGSGLRRRELGRGVGWLAV